LPDHSTGVNINVSAGFESMQRPAVGADKLDRPDIVSFDANSSDKGILSGQFMPFHYFARPPMGACRPTTSRPAPYPEFFNNIKLEGGNGGQFGSLMGG
jgi:hypothetical protein